MTNANNAAAETAPLFHRMGVACPHCRAFNGRSRCGCAAARRERGEKPQPATDLDPVEVVW